MQRWLLGIAKNAGILKFPQKLSVKGKGHIEERGVALTDTVRIDRRFRMNDYETPYFGPERRIEQRRKLPDRRAEPRFELYKEPRRTSIGRRAKELKELWDREIWDNLER